LKLVLKQKAFKLFDTFTVTDEKGNELFTAKGRFSVSRRIDLFDSTGECVGSIREKLIDLLPHYRIYENDELIGDIVKDISVLRDRFSFTFSRWAVTADLVKFSYRILDGRTSVAKIDRRAVRLIHPVYDIELEDPKDAVRVILAFLAIIAMDEDRKKKDSSEVRIKR